MPPIGHHVLKPFIQHVDVGDRLLVGFGIRKIEITEHIGSVQLIPSLGEQIERLLFQFGLTILDMSAPIEINPVHQRPSLEVIEAALGDQALLMG